MIMNQTLTIAKRELTSLFFSPIAYVVLGLFSFVSALLFLAAFQPGADASLRSVFGWIVWLMVFLVPAISMRLLSEELRSGTIELLMTTPVNDTQVIIGKWLGAMGFLLVLLAPLLVFAIILETYANPDWGPILTGIFGLLLVGGFYLAIGTFASAINQNQIIAFLITVFITGFMTIGLYLLPQANIELIWDWVQWVIYGLTAWPLTAERAAAYEAWLTGVPQQLRSVMFFLNVDQHYGDFSRGIVDTSRIIYFASGISLFLFFAVKMLESKRWR